MFVICFAVTGPVAAQAPQPHILHLPLMYDVEFYSNPFQLGFTIDYMVEDCIFDPMVAFSLNGTAIPMLASSWSTSTDGLTWTFNLVHNAVWHDGVPLTSADVKYTFDTGKQIQAPRFAVGLLNTAITSVDTPDNYTVVFHLNEPLADFLFNAGFAPIVPKHIWQNVTDPLNYANDHPIGSGPFMFQQRVPGQFISLVTNPNYYGQKPAYDGVLFTVYTNIDLRILALIKGDLDGETRVPANSVAALLKAPNIQVITQSNPSNVYVQFNFHKYPLTIRQVRQAMTLAVDKKAMLSTILLGFGDQGSDGAIPPALTAWYNPDATWLGAGLNSTQRLNEANALLDSVGFKRGSDGIRVTPNGTRLEFQYYTAGAGLGFGTRPGELFSSMVAPLGIKIDVNFIDVGTLNSYLTLGTTYDMADWRYGVYGPGYLSDTFLTANTAGFWYSNATVDKLLIQQSQTVDYNQRKQLVFQIQTMLMQDVPYIMLFHDNLVNAVRTDRYTGWNPSFLGQDGTGLYGVENVRAFIELTPVTSTPMTTSMMTSATTSTAQSGAPDLTWAVVVLVIAVIALGAYVVKSRSSKNKTK